MVTTAREGRRRCELRIPSGTRHKFAAEALEMAGRQKEWWDAWSSEVQDNVLGKPGRQDRFVPDISEETGVRGWIIVALLEEMVLLEVASSVSCEMHLAQFLLWRV